MTATAFAKLCDDFRKAAGLPDLGIHTLSSGVASFIMTIRDVEVQVCHVPHQPGLVHIFADLGSAAEYDLSVARELAQANALLLPHDYRAVICRRPVTGDYVVRIAMPLDANTPGALLLRCIQSQVAAILSIRADLAAFAMGGTPRDAAAAADFA